MAWAHQRWPGKDTSIQFAKKWQIAFVSKNRLPPNSHDLVLLSESECNFLGINHFWTDYCAFWKRHCKCSQGVACSGGREQRHSCSWDLVPDVVWPRLKCRRNRMDPLHKDYKKHDHLLALWMSTNLYLACTHSDGPVLWSALSPIWLPQWFACT